MEGLDVSSQYVKVKPLKLLKQKYLHSRDSNESLELAEYFDRVSFIKNRLEEVHKALRNYTKQLNLLANSAKLLSTVVETSDDKRRVAKANLKSSRDYEEVIANIKEKLELVNQLKTERKQLNTLKLHLERTERKYRQASNSRRTKQEKVMKRLNKRDAAMKVFEDANEQLVDKLKFLVDETAENGHCSLISPEISAFMAAQTQTFLDCQNLISGPSERKTDLLWDSFSRRVSDTFDRAKERSQNSKINNTFHDRLSKGRNKTASNQVNGKKQKGILFSPMYTVDQLMEYDQFEKPKMKGKKNRKYKAENLQVGMQQLGMDEYMGEYAKHNSDQRRYERAETYDSRYSSYDSEYDDEYYSDESYCEDDIDASFVVRHSKRR